MLDLRKEVLEKLFLLLKVYAVSRNRYQFLISVWAMGGESQIRY